MNIAVIGCGYVAEFYGKTAGNYPWLKLVGAFDLDAKKLNMFCQRWAVKPYASLEELLADPSVEMVLNLTNPRRHFEVSRACLEAGKHVYSEKPLAMDSQQAAELVELAKQKGVSLSSAPCSLLCESAQALGKALSEGTIGKVRLVYANFDDGMIAPQLSPWNWKNESGACWPAKDEFEVGCTYEHAGYVLTWLAACFGPAKRVTAFASCQIPDKGIAVESMTPDFTVGCIEYADNVVARVTCSLIAPKDKSITVIGDKGILSVADVRNDACPVYLQSIPARGWPARIENRVNRLRRFLRLSGADREWHFRRRIPMAHPSSRYFAGKGKPVDFCRGPAELAASIREKRPCRLPAELGLHLVELVETIQYPERFGGPRRLTTTFPSIAFPQP